MLACVQVLQTDIISQHGSLINNNTFYFSAFIHRKHTCYKLNFKPLTQAANTAAKSHRT